MSEMNNKSICLWCEHTSEEISHIRFVDFVGTGYGICQMCYWRLEDDGFMEPNPRRRPVNIIKKIPVYSKALIPKEMRKLVLERDCYKCQYCGREKGLTIDHVIPESKGGLTEPHNLVIACKSCNSKKGVKDAEDMSAIIQRNDSDG